MNCMKCASRHLAARSKDYGFSVAAKQVKGVSVVYIKAGPTGAGGGADDEFSLSGGGSDPSHILSVECGA